MTQKFYLVAALLCSGVAGSFADAPPIPTPYIPTFQGTSTLGSSVVTDTWTNFSTTSYPSYPAFSPEGDLPASEAWPAPLGPDTASGRQSLFQKTPGSESDYSLFLDASSGGGIYAFFSQTHFEITSGLPVSNAAILQLQVSISLGADALDIIAGPVLTLATTSGTFTLNPTTSSLLDQTVLDVPGNGDTTINLEGYNYDVSAYAGTITGVTMDWQVDFHAVTYGVQLAQAVPEPSSVMLLALAGGLPVLRMRSRIRRLR